MQEVNYNDEVVLHSLHNLNLRDGIFKKQGLIENSIMQSEEYVCSRKIHILLSVRFRKSKSKILKEAFRKFYGFFLYFDSPKATLF